MTFRKCPNSWKLSILINHRSISRGEAGQYLEINDYENATFRFPAETQMRTLASATAPTGKHPGNFRHVFRKEKRL